MLQRVLDAPRGHLAGFRELAPRRSQIEHAVGGLRRGNAVHFENSALLNAHLDRMSGRFERVERRLNIGDA